MGWVYVNSNGAETNSLCLHTTTDWLLAPYMVLNLKYIFMKLTLPLMANRYGRNGHKFLMIKSESSNSDWIDSQLRLGMSNSVRIN